MKKREFFFNEFYVAGYTYYDGEKIEDFLLEGKILRFKREPQCQQDPGAVEIYAGRKKLGYIPKKDNHEISQLLDYGMTIKGMICKRNFDDQPRKRIKVTPFREL
jgi:HIRAN domain